MGGGCLCSRRAGQLSAARAGLLCFARILEAKEHCAEVGEPVVLLRGGLPEMPAALAWPWECGNRNKQREVYLFASLALGDRYFEVMGAGYKFRWSLRLDPAALKCPVAAQPASASSEDLALILQVEPSWHKRPFYFGPAAIYANS